MIDVKDEVIKAMSPDAREELQEYIAYMDEIRARLESNFAQYEMAGDKNNMVAMFNRLIDFGMIESGDYRLCEKNTYRTDYNGKRTLIHKKYTGFDDATTSERSFYDPKKSTNYLGVWPFGGLARSNGMLIQNLEHWGIRAEKGYEAPVTFGSNVWPLQFKLVDNRANAEQAANGICKIIEANGAKVTSDMKADLIGFLTSGYQRVYTIRCDKWVLKDQNIGYIRVMGVPGENGVDVQSEAFIDWKIIARHFIPLNKFVAEAKKAFTYLFNRETKFNTVGFEDAREYEKNLVERNNTFAETREGVGMIDINLYK